MAIHVLLIQLTYRSQKSKSNSKTFEVKNLNNHTREGCIQYNTVKIAFFIDINF